MIIPEISEDELIEFEKKSIREATEMCKSFVEDQPAIFNHLTILINLGYHPMEALPVAAYVYSVLKQKMEVTQLEDIFKIHAE